jgi:hypothetical protein
VRALGIPLSHALDMLHMQQDRQVYCPVTFQCPHELCMFCDDVVAFSKGYESAYGEEFQCPHELCMFCDGPAVPSSGVLFVKVSVPSRALYVLRPYRAAPFRRTKGPKGRKSDCFGVFWPPLTAIIPYFQFFVKFEHRPTPSKPGGCSNFDGAKGLDMALTRPLGG